MDLTPTQRSVLLELTTEWQTPKQIADKLPEAGGNPSYVNEALKELIREGLVQANPAVFGLYRLTKDGMDIKTLELDINQ
ncbi:hypothetical protein ACFFF5_08145 [Lederbergia wuyishanensis]|uniref:Transcriptional regulator n=1 Tax=Lederbergia wuyishanensis TaxID=1347903 RepID=A0ABU0D6G8_9BACI|nr:hypothetical protein [Lederbergia wuyishanensis]MCJ8008573.1 hypothetical protein [Lederbergia wuyishanensis]MDQ0344012.1 putative transcriptional regulator [Lederbergia wuyishanensis]